MEENLFVSTQEDIYLKCPHCEQGRHQEVQQFKNKKHRLLISCRCGEKFIVNLNFRQAFRKKTKLPAKYINHSDWQNSLRSRNQASFCEVVDLSCHGMAIKIPGLMPFREEDQIQVNFCLDDRDCSVIDRQAIVRRITGDIIGCEFADSDTLERSLGFYLMS